MCNKKRYIIIGLLMITFILSACRVKVGDTVIRCNELTGECTVVGGNSSNNYDASTSIAGTFIPDDVTVSISKCGPYKAPDKGIFKGFYYDDSEPNSTENRWSMSACGTSSYLTTAETTCSDGRTYKWTIHKLAKTTFEKVQQGLCEITTTGIDGITYDPSEITSNGSWVSRFISGTKTPTLHAYGIAIDINAGKDYEIDGKKYEDVYDRDRSAYDKFVEALGDEYDQRNVNFILYKKIFQPLGFNWGGNWKSYDGMHFEIDYDQTKK